MSGQASQNVMVEINKLVGKGVIEYTEHEKGEFISPIFFRSKSDGTRRLILNLKISFGSRLDSATLLHDDYRFKRCLLLSEDIGRRHEVFKILCRKKSFEICCATKWIVFRPKKVYKVY